MAEEPLDLIVVGGGITGAGILWDATLRGLKAGLVEMQDFAAGTSSRSTKLVHGGLRYLEQYEFALVREVGRERAVLHHLAPHVVRPTQMLLPIVPSGRYGRSKVAFGVWLYDRLANVAPAERRRMLDRQETLAAEPLLRPDALGSCLYYEYTTDDARLTLEVLKSAVAHGALAANYARVDGFVYRHDGRLRAATVVDALQGKTYEIEARKVVNAAGPWADRLRDKDGSLDAKRLRLSKGVHIVLDAARLPLSRSIYFENDDGRMIFAIPKGRTTYVGTTDTDYSGDPIAPSASAAELDYLTRALNRTFPTVELRPSDVISSWAGLRPLIYQPGRSASATSRHDELISSPSGLLSIAGGKLTGFRKMAERVVDKVVQEIAPALGHPLHPCRTAAQALSGGSGGPAEWRAQVEKWVRAGKDAGLREDMATAIAKRYGSNTPAVLSYLRQSSVAEVCPPTLPYSMAQEMAVRAVDVLIRRTGMLHFAPAQYRNQALSVVAAMAKVYAWEPSRTAAELRDVETAYRSATFSKEELMPPEVCQVSGQGDCPSFIP